MAAGPKLRTPWDCGLARKAEQTCDKKGHGEGAPGMLHLIPFCALIGAQVLVDDPFYGKTVGDYPDYAQRESRARPQPRMGVMAQTVSRVGSVDEASRLFNLAGMAYCSNDTTGVPGSKYAEGLGSKIQVALVVEDEHLKTRGIILLDESRRQILLAFRGTSGVENWQTNLNFNKVPFGPGVVHAGFKSLADALLPKYQAALLDFLQAHPDYRLVIVGHSLGGAIAVLSAIHLAEQVPWQRISVYTYGQPRVGDRAVAEWLNAQSLQMTRVVVDTDSVPHLPPNFAGFFHAHTEMFLRGRAVKICATTDIEDPTCSASRIALPSRVPHSTAFNLKLGPSHCEPPKRRNARAPIA